MRFQWIADRETKRVETLRFTRALFGLSSSPFLLGGVIRQHLDNCRQTYSLYVDDLINGGPTVEAARQIKEVSTEIFALAGFTLHKWHASAAELDAVDTRQNSETQETPKRKGSAPWNFMGGEGREEESIEVKFPPEHTQPTKRGLLGKLSRVYDPLGLVSPTTLSGKLLYREVCELKVAWDSQLPAELRKKLSRWEEGLPSGVNVSRPPYDI